MRIHFAALLIFFTADLSADAQRSTEQIGNEIFEVWHESGDDFAMYCKEPCDAEDEQIRTYHRNFRELLPQLIQWHGVDVLEELKPVEIHLNASSICPPLAGAAGYAEIGIHRGWDQQRGVNCLFEVERDAANLATRNQVLSLHEYAHLILFRRHIHSYEWFPYWSSWDIVEPTHMFADPCSDYYGRSTRTITMHRLCRDFGLDKNDVRAAIVELDRRFGNEEGFYSRRASSGYTTSLAELRSLIDAQVSADTASAWLAGGANALEIGMEFTVGPHAGSYEAVEEHFRVSFPDHTLQGDRAFRLDALKSIWGQMPFTHWPRAFAIVAEGKSDSPYTETVEFERPVTLEIRPQPFFLNDQPIERYDLLTQHRTESGEFYWRPVRNSGYDKQTGMLQARVQQTGLYAYGPSFQAPSGLFHDPNFSGHGFDFQMAGDEVTVMLFTFDPYGDPLWVVGSAPLGNDPEGDISAVQMDLRIQRLDEETGQLSSLHAGSASFQFYGSWGAAGWTIRANAELNLGKLTDFKTVAMNLRPLPFGSSIAAEQQVTGRWHEPAGSGWGLAIDRRGDTEVSVAYFYDENGQPRWTIGSRPISDDTTPLDAVTGYCLGCPNVGTTTAAAGIVQYEFEEDGRRGRASIDVAWPNEHAPSWRREDADIIPLSNPPLYRVDPNPTTARGTKQAPSTLSAPDSVTPEMELATPFEDCAMPHAAPSSAIGHPGRLTNSTH